MPLMKDQVFKRLSKKAKKGMRGWPLATIAYYGPDASRATKVVVSIFSAEGSEDPTEMRDWQIVHGACATSRKLQRRCSTFMEGHGARSTVMSSGLMGCSHQEGIDYEGEYCPDPACRFWHGRDWFTHKLVQ